MIAHFVTAPFLLRIILFPFDGARRLGGDVVNDAVDSCHFVADSSGHFVEDFPREAEVISSHAIRACYSADAYGVVIGSFVALYAYGADSCRQYSEGLPDIIVEAMLFDDVSDDEISSAEDVESFRGDFADDADSKTWSRERLAVDDFFRKSEFAAELADFILEEFAQRFDEFELHVLRKAAYVVVGFDGRSGGCAGFHDVRIECALDEEFHVIKLIGFFLEGMNEFSADGLSLLFRFGYACKKVHEMLGCIDVDEFHVEFVCEGVDDLFSFAKTEETVIDENAGQLIADSLVDKDSGNSSVATEP